MVLSAEQPTFRRRLASRSRHGVLLRQEISRSVPNLVLGQQASDDRAYIVNRRNYDARIFATKARHINFLVIFLFVRGCHDDERSKSKVNVFLCRQPFRDYPLEIIIANRTKADLLNRRSNSAGEGNRPLAFYLGVYLVLGWCGSRNTFGLEREQPLIYERLQARFRSSFDGGSIGAPGCIASCHSRSE